MTKDTFWIFAFCLPTVAVLTESLLPEHKTYAPLYQNAFVIKTWTYRDYAFYVRVTKGNILLLTTSFMGGPFMEDKDGLFIKYNKSREEVSLLFNNVTRDDEGLYQITSIIYQRTAKGIDTINETFNVQLNVLEPSEIKQGYAGDSILITEFLQESIFFPRLYHNDQFIAVLIGSDCDVSSNSPFYGRIRCSKNTDNNTTRIEINHVTENDNGLYTVEAEGSLTQQCFLNITERFDANNSDQTRNITLPATVRSRTAVNRAHSISYTTSTNVLHISTAPESSKVIISDQPSMETLPTTVFTRSPVNPAYSLCVPIYVIAVIIGAVGFIHFIGCLIWSQRRKIHITKTEQHNVHDECDPGLYLTPISLEPPLTLPTCQERKTGHTNIAQNKTLDQSTRSINMAQMLSMDGYEVVDISNNDDPEITPELEEIIHESTENVNTPYSDTSGYLTVLARSETTV